MTFLKTEVYCKNLNPDPATELPWQRAAVPEDDRQRTGSRSGQQTAWINNRVVKQIPFSDDCIVLGAHKSPAHPV